jgi:hypothetical protein
MDLLAVLMVAVVFTLLFVIPAWTLFRDLRSGRVDPGLD